MTEKALSALTSAIYLSRLLLEGKSVDTDDKRLRASGLYADWTPGAHQAGEIYNAEGQTWECVQAYDNAVFPDIQPGEPAWYTFNRPLHGTTPETARPFVPVQGSHDIYRAGEYMILNGTIWLCGMDTNFSPEEYGQAWKFVEAKLPENDSPDSTEMEGLESDATSI